MKNSFLRVDRMKKIVLIAIIALSLRLLFVGFWYETGHGGRVASDAETYYEIAKNLTDGKGFQLDGLPTARRPPLYPVWIAFLAKFGGFPLGVRLGDALAGAFSCVLMYLLGRELFTEKAGFLSAGLLAFDYMSVRQMISVLPETLFMFFLLLSFYCFVCGLKSEKSAWFFGAGFFGGCSLLTREVLILYFPMLACWVFAGSLPRSKRLIRTVLFLAGLMITVAPWILRNSFLYRQPVMITATAGHSFYIANNLDATGGRTGGEWEWEKDSYLPKDPNLKVYQPEGDRKLFGKAMIFILKNPERFLGLMKTKIVNTWRPSQTDSRPAAQWVTAVPYLFTMVFGVVGMWMCLPKWRVYFPMYLLVGYIFLLHSVLIAEIRYRYPAMPFIMLFAAFAFSKLFFKTMNADKATLPSKCEF